MHIGLLIDHERLHHELNMLDRLGAGLLEAGETVTLFIPEGSKRDELPPPLDELAHVEFPARVPPWLNGNRARQLASEVEKSTPEVLYAVGVDAWSVGTHFAGVVGRPLALDVWSARQVRMVPRGRSAQPVAACVVPTESIARSIERRIDPSLVSVVPPGIDVPATPRPIMEGSTRSLAVIGGGRDVRSYIAMLTAMSRLVRDVPQLQAAIELRGPHAHDIWREARRLDLLGHLSAITEAEPLRALLTRCDALLMPERFGEMRTLTLEAMAQGMVIVGAADPYLDMLEDGETAVLADEPDTEQWVRLLRKVLLDQDEARRLGAAAHAMVAERYTTSDQLAALRRTFDRMIRGETIPFSTATGGAPDPT